MLRLNRRALLASSTAVAAITLSRIARAATYVTPVNEVIGGGPPVARVAPVTETLWGVKVTDRYRWMESEDPEWQSYIHAQGDYATKLLATIPGSDQLAEQIAKYTSEVVLVSAFQTGGNKIFSEVRPAGANTSKLYVRDGMTGADSKIVDADSYAQAGSHASLDWWSVSPDGGHVAFGVSPGGSEKSTLHILDVASNKLLAETIDRTDDASPSWLPDGSGFFYNRLQAGVSRDSTAYEEKSVCWLHKLGTDPATDVKILAQNTAPNVALADIDFPGVFAATGSDLALGVIISGVQNEIAAYAAKLADAAAGKPAWQKICDPADMVTGAAIRGETIYLLTHQNASRYKVVKTTASSPAYASATEAVPQSDSVIRSIAAGRDALYLLDLDAGLGGLRRLTDDGKITQIALPFQGSIDQDSFYADTLHDGVWFLLEGWVHPAAVCHCGADGMVQVTDIAPSPPIDVATYTSEEVLVPVRDGVKVPLSIVYKKGLKKTGAAPLLLEAYGAYGITLDPAFIARWLTWLDLGGIFAIAHVRGGGELGEDWHLAGQKLTKHHTWQDTIDCAQWLIDENYTSHKTLATIGGSAGGITMGRLLTERPDLAAVVIDQVGVSDAMRSEFSPNGPPNIPEFGTVTDKAGFKALYAMDAYQHVRDGVKYPSIMLTTGLNDPRVSSWEPTKMTARLQAANASKNPIILRVETDAGHGIGSTRSQRDKETADVMAFILWRTGNPAYQPKT